MRRLNVKIKHCRALNRKIKKRARKRTVRELKKKGFIRNKKSRKF